MTGANKLRIVHMESDANFSSGMNTYNINVKMQIDANLRH